MLFLSFCVFGLLVVAAFFINFFGTKERVKSAATEEGITEDIPFATGIKALFKNKYWIMMTGMLALFFLMYSVNGGVIVFYVKEILGDRFVLSVLERLASRYGTRKGLWGIEILNEPITDKAWKLMDVPNRYPAVERDLAEGSGSNTMEFLKDFYCRAYDRIRKYMPEEK